MRFDQPFHEGEIRAQKLAGEFEMAGQTGRMIGDEIPGGALAFIENQPFTVIGSSDPKGRLWASVLLGEPGFMRASDRRTVTYDLSRAVFSARDPLWANLDTDPKVGTLIIDLATRRRLRINGNLSKTGDDSLELFVSESFPNCPKFIQRRHFAFGAVADGKQSSDNITGAKLEHRQIKFIRKTDTVFVTSAHNERGLDASHKGGKPGFIQVLDDSTLRIPDYPGNGMFQTFGNLLTNPKAGLTFLDFEGKRVLQLTGTASIEWNAPELGEETGGTGRFWDFKVEQWIETGLPDGIRWEFVDFSPYNPE